MIIFQSTHPSWGATINIVFSNSSHYYFNPRTHRGVRHKRLIDCTYASLFQSTHPSWGATLKRLLMQMRLFNFNPRTHRGVRQSSFLVTNGTRSISIHAPIVGCDLQKMYLNGEKETISIHAPIVGCDGSDM